MVSCSLIPNEAESDARIPLCWPAAFNDQIKEENAAEAKSYDDENGYESEDLVPSHFPTSDFDWTDIDTVLFAGLIDTRPTQIIPIMMS